MKKFFIIIFSLAFLLLIFSLLSYAAPLTNVSVTLTQPDGTVIECFASGDEFFNYTHDKDGRLIKEGEDGWYRYCTASDGEIYATGAKVGIAEDDADLSSAPAADSAVTISEIESVISAKTLEGRLAMEILAADSAPSLTDPTGQTPSQTSGYDGNQINNIVVYICFKDEDTTAALSTLQSRAQKLNAAYNTGYTQYGNSAVVSVKGYFNEVTNGHLNIQTTMFPTATDTTQYLFYEDINLKSYYQPYSSTNVNGYSGETERRDREFSLLYKAVNYITGQVNASGINLDVDGDGYVDSISFLINGGPDGWNSLLWPHQWSIYDRVVNLCGKRVYTFSFNLLDQMFTKFGSYESLFIGTVCHEMMHTFGFPDLYDYMDQSNNPIGYYDLMANNLHVPQYSTVYTRLRWGGQSWFNENQIQTLSSGSKQSLTLQCSTSDNGAVAFVLPSSLTGYTTNGGSHTRDIYIEYRGEDGPYSAANLIYYINPNGGYIYMTDTNTFGFCKNGILVYETDDDIADNTRLYYDTGYVNKDNYALFAYRKNNTIANLPMAFESGSILIGVTNGKVIYISNIVQSADKSSVTFDLEIRPYQTVEIDLDDKGTVTVTEQTESISPPDDMTVSQLIAAISCSTVGTGVMNTYQTTYGMTANVYDRAGNIASGDIIPGNGYTLVINVGSLTYSLNITKLLGDLDGDNILTVSEVNTIISYIINGSMEVDDELFGIADVNDDGIIDILDIIVIVPMITPTET